MCLNYRMSIREFISKYRTSLNNGQKKWSRWRTAAPTNALEVKLKEDGRLADIIMKGQLWNGRALANKVNNQEFKKVQNAMNEWKKLHPIESMNNTNNTNNINTTPKSFWNRLINSTGVSLRRGGSKNKRTHKKRNRTKRNKRN